MMSRPAVAMKKLLYIFLQKSNKYSLAITRVGKEIGGTAGVVIWPAKNITAAVDIASSKIPRYGLTYLPI